MSGDEKGEEGVTMIEDVALIAERCFSCELDGCERRDVYWE